MEQLLSLRTDEPFRVVVHGGAGRIPEDKAPLYAEGVKKAVNIGLEVLRGGGSALDAVVEAVAYMEDDPTFNAGKGSVLNSEGFIEMDAIVIDGSSLSMGAVAAVRRVKNPVRLARVVMERTDHNMFASEWADRLAEVMGLELADPSYFLTERRKREWEEMRTGRVNPSKEFMYSTVGAVAIDEGGNLAAATSTGGTPLKMPGRVGDTPLVGSGAYADNTLGGASATGLGESIMRVVLSKTALDLVSQALDPASAAKRAIEIMEKRVGGGAGLILIDSRGNVGLAYNTPAMSFAFNEGSKVVYGVGVAGRRMAPLI
ncbi:MAG: isoaspartyl peptidase/L-asparaginase [Candidatus Korarchaeota archaeon]|nr:isoaspartyl peptidase/L-asparaginase [Candidatus Korarchaeota archaeon]